MAQGLSLAPTTTVTASSSAPVFVDLSSNALVNAIKIPVEPMKVAMILSEADIGHNHANIRIAIPDIPNTVIRNMPSDLSFIAFGLPFERSLLHKTQRKPFG